MVADFFTIIRDKLRLFGGDDLKILFYFYFLYSQPFSRGRLGLRGWYIESRLRSRRSRLVVFSSRRRASLCERDASGHIVREYGSPRRYICVPESLHTAEHIVLRYIWTVYNIRRFGTPLRSSRGFVRKSRKNRTRYLTDMDPGNADHDFGDYYLK